MALFTAFTVEVEFVSGTWTDVTDDVDLGSGVSIRRGRNSVLDVAQIGTCSFRMFNDSGDYTPGSGASQHYPNVRPNVGVRVSVEGSTRFTGFVDSWVPGYPSGSAHGPVVDVTATDRFRLFARRKLHDTYSETVRVTVPSASVWRMDMAAGSECGDLLGVRPPVRVVTPRGTQTNGLPGTITYGDSGPERVSSAVKLAPGKALQTGGGGYTLTDDSAGPVLQLPAPITLPVGSADEWTLAFWVNVDDWYDRSATDVFYGQYTGQLVATVNDTGWSIWLEGDDPADMTLKLMDTSGGWFATGTVGEFRDGWHHVAVTWDGSDMAVQIDNVAVAAGSPATSAGGQYGITLGGILFGQFGYRVWNHATLSVCGVTYSPSYVDADGIAGLYEASSTGYTGDAPWNRFPRILAMAGVDPSGYDIDHGASYSLGSANAALGPLDTDGQDLVTLGQEIAQAERGVFYIEPDGTVRLADRYARQMSTVADATFDQELATTGTDFAAPIEDAQIANTVTITAADGTTATAIDLDSVQANGTLTFADTINVDSQAQAADRASWHVANFGVAIPRISQVTVDMLTATTDIYSDVFDLDIGSRIKITNLPTLSQPATVFEGIIEGATETYSSTDASVTFDTSPVTPAEIVLDDDDLGRLDANGETLTADCADSDTSIIVAAHPGFDGGDVPYDVVIGGEQMTVTAVAAGPADRTNLCPNPSFEVGVNGWAASGTWTATRALTTDHAWAGNRSLKVTWTNGGTGGQVMGFTLPGLTVSTVYTLSGYVFVPAGGTGVRLHAVGVTNAYQDTTVTGQWQRLVVTFTATATSHVLGVTPAAYATAGDICYLDGVLVEEGGPGSYFDGTTESCVWTGVEQLSTSTCPTQELTVTRAVGGTPAVAHSSGTEIRIARSLVLAL